MLANNTFSSFDKQRLDTVYIVELAISNSILEQKLTIHLETLTSHIQWDFGG